MVIRITDIVKNRKTYYKSKKEGDFVVLLDELKSRLSAYQEPLEDLRDSL